MKKYLQVILDRLKGLDAGMLGNALAWQNQPVTEVQVKTKIGEINQIDADIEALEDQLSEKRNDAQTLKREGITLADQVELLAIGIHHSEPEKLVEYNIKLRKPAEKVPSPTKVLIPVLEDDTDGEGFIVSTQTDPVAARYEWQKGVATDPADESTIPPMNFLKVTSKTKFVDDDILPGKRYFYRVRAENASGNGPWSEAVSRVQ